MMAAGRGGVQLLMMSTRTLWKTTTHTTMTQGKRIDTGGKYVKEIMMNGIGGGGTKWGNGAMGERGFKTAVNNYNVLYKADSDAVAAKNTAEGTTRE